MGRRVLALGGELVGEAHELGAEELRLRALELHGEVVPDALAAFLMRAAHVVVDQRGGAARESGVLVAEKHAAAEAVLQRLVERVDDGAFLDQGLDHPLLAGLVGVNDAQVAELRVDVADAGDGRAVVVHAAHQQKVAGLEGQVAAGGEGGIEQGIEVGAAEAAHGLLVRAELRVTDVELAQHVGGVARDAQRVAHGALSRQRHEPARMPVGNLLAQAQPVRKERVYELRRRAGERGHVVAVEAHVVDGRVHLREVVGKLGCGRRRTRRERLGRGEIVLELCPGHSTQHQFPPPCAFLTPA